MRGGTANLKKLLVAIMEVDCPRGTVSKNRKDAPDGRPVEPSELGPVIPISEVGGLHHRYVRRAA